MDCIFCKIIAGEIPAKVVLRDDDVVAIEDVNPQAPTHLLVMPVRHVSNIDEMSPGTDGALMAKLIATAARLGREHGRDGYRLVINTGPDGGQTVDHTHVHVLAGRHLTWPPG
ncbi:MAG: histidine triad nucleotide-binding protein [Candidatus Eremiobacteraeota bacterium]|nr:histidine triad nucleotide-binding protein [Candidatus Eremiobacteraeota bacterium]